MPKCSDPRRHWLLPAKWPEIDRRLWLQAQQQVDDLADGPSVAHLRSESVRTREKGYGFWLNYLQFIGDLEPQVIPGDRVTPARLSGLLRLLEALNYKPQSKVIVISSISSMMKLFHPERDWRWIWTPNGGSLGLRLQSKRAVFPIPEPSVLYLWGAELIAGCDRIDNEGARYLRFRDGLIICILSAEGIRRRTLWKLNVTKHIRQHGSRWRLILDETDLKRPKVMEIDLPVTLTEPMTRYLTIVRPALLNGSLSNALWIGADGSPLALGGLNSMMRRRSQVKFGFPFGPHRTRHAIGTYAPILDPANPGLASAILGVTPTIHQRHYNRAANHVAFKRFHKVLSLERGDANSDE